MRGFFSRRARDPDAWLPGVPTSALHANCAVVGASGSGKTVLLKRLLKLLLAEGHGLFTAAVKADDMDWIEPLVAAGGRDPVTLRPGCGVALSPFLDLTVPALDPGSQAVIDSGMLESVGEAVQRLGGSGGGSDGSFFQSGARSVSRMAFGLLRYAGATPTFALARQVLADAASSPRALATERFRSGLVYRLSVEALRRHKGGPREAAARKVADYWSVEYPRVPPRTRAGYTGYLLPSLDLLTTGVVGELFGGTGGSLDLRALVEGGGVLLSDFNPGTYQSLGVAANSAIKFTLQRLLLSRRVTPVSPFFFQVLDEYPLVCAETDAAFFATARSARAPTVIALQGRESLLEAWPGPGGEARAGVVLGNCAVKAFTRSTPDTARWLSESLGGRLAFTFSGSSGGSSYSTPGSLWSGVDASANASANWSEQSRPWVEPWELYQLRTGSDADRKEVQAIVTPGGRDAPFRRVAVKREG